MVLTMGLGASAALWGCGSDTAPEDIDVSALTNEELALSALRIMGAPKVPGVQGTGACGACHSMNQVNLKKWKESYDSYMGETGLLRDTTKTQTQRINSMRRDPNNSRTKFAAGKIGILAAGVHLGLAANVLPDKHPNAYAQGKFLAELFKGKNDVYDTFRKQMLMPIEASHPRLTATEYETIFTWLAKGLPEAEKYIPEAGRPTTCTNNFAPLKAHASSIKSKNWSVANRDAQMPMFACDSPSAAPDTCFQQKKGSADVFPLARTQAYGAGWELEGSNVRILRALNYSTYYWMRTSPDGRFVGNGGGPEGSAVFADLAPALSGGTRDIVVEANYDPDFFPDNKGFVFQGGNSNGTVCPMTLMTNPATTRITLQERGCSATGFGLYQTVGQRLADNDIGDRYAITSEFASDEHHQGETEDTDVSAGAGDGILVSVLRAKGNDQESGYETLQRENLDTPFRGDAMMSRSGMLVSTRIGGPNGNPIGYSVDKMLATPVGNKYRFVLQDGGKVCMIGNKANLSFDERFLTTQHYVSRKDFASDAEYAPYKDKGAADIWISDFVTGKITRAIKMNPGQFAVFPHFRSDGWLYVLVRDSNTSKEYIVASDIAIRMTKAVPTP